MAAARLAVDPNDKNLIRRAEGARKRHGRNKTRGTRLFIVDVGLDDRRLRAKYPDNRRYAIVRGLVCPYVLNADGTSRIAGRVNGLNIEQINVTHAFRPVFEPLIGQRTPRHSDRRYRYTTSVAFGQRFEPWIIAASRDVSTQ